MRRPGWRIRARRLGFGLSTLFGVRDRGFFIPYRFAAGVKPSGYPALEPLFRAGEPGYRTVLSRIESYGPELLHIHDGAGPARFDQDWFPRLDAAASYAIVREERPRRIIEIGSGHSTRFLARAVADGGLATDILAIDPQPRASLESLRVSHHATVLERADSALFAALEPADILFVDSSHIAMPGTDLDRILGDILPRLRPGILVHIHDILLPDAYPPEWRWRGYNEAIPIAALLQGEGYEIVFSSHWVASRWPERLAQGCIERLPLRPGARETSLWLRKR